LRRASAISGPLREVLARRSGSGRSSQHLAVRVEHDREVEAEIALALVELVEIDTASPSAARLGNVGAKCRVADQHARGELELLVALLLGSALLRVARGPASPSRLRRRCDCRAPK
jgi:hypothetical protein